eukprot:TRINITY_DN23413_c0_g1_i1.p2 TRINITY_DN23413_c0_g1~~TRINITY_DN23413_c0_g1_i1.p2  ORF type:complete len:176 (+),score=40.08 TRINITY_DN23413_c0_g1_i1:65-592(+)
MSTRDWLRYSGPISDEDRARFKPRWQEKWLEKCHADCCYSPACGNIRCSNCSKSIVQPRCRTRYYCMNKDCVDYCEDCFEDENVLHQHAEFLRITQTGQHEPVTREKGVGEITLDMLNRLPYNTELPFTECTICTCNFTEGEQVALMPPCVKHGFHTDCIKPFIQWCNNCPNCLQ